MAKSKRKLPPKSPRVIPEQLPRRRESWKTSAEISKGQQDHLQRLKDFYAVEAPTAPENSSQAALKKIWLSLPKEQQLTITFEVDGKTEEYYSQQDPRIRTVFVNPVSVSEKDKRTVPGGFLDQRSVGGIDLIGYLPKVCSACGDKPECEICFLPGPDHRKGCENQGSIVRCWVCQKPFPVHEDEKK